MPHPPDAPARSMPNAEAVEFDWYVGIDCGGATHQVWVLDAQGHRVGERAVAHSGAALAAFVAWLHELAGPSLARVAVGVETPHGGPVALCLEHGAAVFAINPKQLERFRERASAAGAKDDRRDAFVAASALRTDRAAFHRLAPEAAALVQVRELSRVSDELREEAARLSNRLRAQLERYFPQLLTLVPAADEPWLWALLTLAPTPAAAVRLSERRLTRLLRDYRIRRVSAADVRALLQAPALPVAPGTAEAVSAHVALLVPQLELVTRQHRACLAQLTAALTALAGPEDGPPAAPNADGAAGAGPTGADRLGPIVRLLRSLPGVGVGVAGVLLAEAAPALVAGDYHALRTHGGAAPVTKQSGKQRLVVMRYACNHRLRTALFHWARVSIQHDPAAHQYYAALRARGHSHARTLRSLADRWLRILTAMLTTRTAYDAGRFAVAAPPP